MSSSVSSLLTSCFYLLLIHHESFILELASALKRKRGKASASEIIEYVAKSLDTCLEVLEKAEIAFKGTYVTRYFCSHRG